MADSIHEVSVFTNADGAAHVRCDAPGERAVSAPIDDPMQLIVDICEACDLEYDEDALPDKVVISWPPGA
jgi:hypothetical protein